MQTLLLRIKENGSQLFNWLKWLSVPLVLLALYYQLAVKSDFNHTIELFTHSISLNKLPYLLLVLLLMPVNLGTEALKWKLLLKNSHKISLLDSFRSVFAGISLSIFTPKRVGEYAGRLLLLEGNRVSAAGSLFVGNFSQMIANLVLGLISAFIFLRYHEVDYDNMDWLIPFSVICGIAMIIAYFNLDKVLKWASKFSLIQKVSDKLSVISTYNNQTLFSFLALSFVKYIVFVLQFVLLLFAFGISIKLLWGLIAASCVFFIKTMLPVPASVELAARGSIAIYFFSFFTENHIGILVASIVLWIVNLAIPALIGSYFISKKKL